MSYTELPDEPSLEELWRDPDDGMLKRRHNLGCSYNGYLYVRPAKKGGSTCIGQVTT